MIVAYLMTFFYWCLQAKVQQIAFTNTKTMIFVRNSFKNFLRFLKLQLCFETKYCISDYEDFLVWCINFYRVSLLITNDCL